MTARKRRIDMAEITLALCCQDLDETMTSILKRMVRENPRFFSNWLLSAVEKQIRGYGFRFMRDYLPIRS